ncbi:MAG TPA: hypothetical protein EYG57_19715 [Planctomycetes bacterium]|nr:hypothetical protein [Planctomycetota bacterium]
MLASLVDRSRQHIASMRGGNDAETELIDRLRLFVGHLDLDTRLSLAACRALVEHFLARHREQLTADGLDWLQRTAHPAWRGIIVDCSGRSEVLAHDPDPLRDPDWAALEESLWAKLSEDRKAFGIYYTPPQVVDYLLEASLAEARRHVDDWSCFAALDPAAGGGRFVVRLLDRMLRTTNAEQSIAEMAHIVGRMTAFDIRPSALCVTQLSLSLVLAHHKIPFRSCPGPDLRIGDTLRDPNPHWQDDRQLTDGKTRWLMVVGNPPFASLSRNASPWITGLLRGKGLDDAAKISYTKSAGICSPSKHWLDDDYVKFLRYAHWRVDGVGAGTIGFVLGNGFTDNASFAALRFALLNSFDRVSVVNLHGSAKRGLSSQDGVRDESIFGIEQGVALLLLTKYPGRQKKLVVEPTIDRSDLLGRRVDKLARLGCATDGSQPLDVDRFVTFPPRFLFARGNELLHGEFQRGVELASLFKVSSSAIVTARDALVIAPTKEQLLDQLSQVADAAIETQAIREKFFPRARSRRYQRGDTRGWSLEEARERLRAESDWDRFVVEIDYRPWDRRYLFYAPWMVDWPRKQVSDVMLGERNCCLITRRQMVPDRAANFFWVTTRPTLDGIIRSDNRGNETLYPLYLGQPEQECARRPRNITESTKCQLMAAGSGLVASHDQQLFDYLFAMFSSLAYQAYFAECLWHEAPRVFSARCPSHFHELAAFGTRLRELATSDLAKVDVNDTSWPAVNDIGTRVSGKGTGLRYQDGQIVASDGYRCPVPRNVWEFQVGSHRVVRKWYREHQYLGSEQFGREFRAVLSLIRDTLAVRRELDGFYDRCGGISQVHHIE